jgi:hypothetical protein
VPARSTQDRQGRLLGTQRQPRRTYPAAITLHSSSTIERQQTQGSGQRPVCGPNAPTVLAPAAHMPMTHSIRFIACFIVSTIYRRQHNLFCSSQPNQPV